MAIVAGVDGIPGGWVSVLLDDAGFAGAIVLKPADTSFTELAGARVIGIDIPIGYGPREADRQARKILGPCRGSSRVFTIPTRQVLENALSEGTYRAGLGLSAQTFHIGERMRDVSALAARDKRLYEVHPEISFRAMKGACLDHPKDTYGGFEERKRLLHSNGIRLRISGEVARVGVNDVLDAAAAAWSARRIAAGEASSLPDPPQRAGNRDVAIWY